MSLLNPDEKTNFIFRLIEIALIIGTAVYVFAVADARSITNERDLKEYKETMSSEIYYIRTRIDFLIELQLKKGD